MARTGLRMPTFPSPSLKFRTAGFPRYGFKASLSGRAFPNLAEVKPAPGMPVSTPGLHRPFARFHHRHSGLALCPGLAVLPRAAVREARGLPTPGVLGSGPSSAVSVHPRVLRPHPSVSRARGDFAASGLYPASSLCGHASATRETFPTFTAVLATRAIDPTPAGSRDLSHCVTVRDARLPRSLSESPPASDRLCQQYLTALCISTHCCPN